MSTSTECHAPRRRRATLTAAVAAVIALGVCGTAGAHERSLHCGDVLTRSVRLHQDLLGCTGPGLVIGADDVTVDLGGHTISGTDDGSAGIDDFAGHGGTVVVHGTLRGFTDGAAFAAHASRARVRDVTVNDAAFAGILLLDASDNRVQASRFSGVGRGVFLFRSSRTRVEGNDIADTSAAGVEVDGASTDNDILRNRITRTFDIGIVIAVFDDDPASPPEFPSGNTVSGNVLNDTSFGILLVEANANAITENSVRRAGRFGDPGSPGGAIGLDGGNGNLLARNVVSASRGHGIQIGSEEDPHPLPPTANRLVANLALDNGGDGIRVNAIAHATVLERNTADRNADFGINAIAPVIDGGHNSAAANGEPAQCAGIDCRARPG
jgi:parallel beta-helix repeat protein